MNKNKVKVLENSVEGKISLNKKQKNPQLNKPMNQPIKKIVYIIGVALDTTGRLCDELKKIYGINTHRINIMLRGSGLLQSTKVYMLKPHNIRSMERILNEQFVVGADLRRKEYDNIQRHRTLGTYKGVRMRAGLPVHGQRTSTNAKTAGKLNKKRCKL